MNELNVLDKDLPLAMKLYLYMIGQQATIQNLHNELFEATKRLDQINIKLIKERIRNEEVEFDKALKDLKELQDKYKYWRRESITLSVRRVK
ncbi:hypothetical protein [Evansella tamaricis]|uniref:Uncharacterized protein n=1 Tax=Evansella tamaricis TaxID=2069301 RepID=A0ABS6JC80_9BACI|nr:hypothetical protein [Evansella tamaricis]MBU9711108.1 hypothetical protein [Evansella tamaricis]